MYKMAKWTREQTTMLLELYKQYPHLYDNRNICYSDRNERQNTLFIIAKKLEKIRPKTTVRDLKQKIRTIRTQYCVEKHKFQKSQSKDCYLPRLWCYDYLKFLDGIAYHDNVNNKQHLTGYEAITPMSPIPIREKDDCLPQQHSEYEVPSPMRQQHNEDFETNRHSGNQDIGGLTPLVQTEPKQLDTELDVSNLSQNSEHITCVLGESISPTIHLVQQLAQRMNDDKKSRNVAFAKFISEELDSIQDREILEDTKWDIQMAIRNALKQDRKRKDRSSNSSFQSITNRLILSPSPSQSSSSVCFQHAGVKQEMSEDDN